MLRIWIRVSITLTNGSVSNPDVDPDPAIFVTDFQDVKKFFFLVFLLISFEGTFTSFSKIKIHEEVTKQ